MIETTDVVRETATTQNATVFRASRGVMSRESASVSDPGDAPCATPEATAGCPSGSRPYSSGRFLMRREAGMATAIMTIPIPSRACLKPCDSIPHAITGTRKPPSWTPDTASAIAIARLRMNQLLTRVTTAIQPPIPEPSEIARYAR